jgi:hypothetical protein
MVLIKKFLPASLIVVAATIILLFGFQALAQSKKFNASVSFKKDSNGLFTIIINDPEGVKEFSLIPPKKFPYGGGVGGSCPRSHKITNVLFEDPADFTPAMTGYVIDCQGNQTDLEIPPPQNGSALSRVVLPLEPEPEPKSVEQKPAEKPASAPEKPVAKPVADLTKSDIKYPVPELGNCADEKECRAYCDDRNHGRECIDFAKRHKLIADDEVDKFEKSLEAVKNGPGGCNSAGSCEAYCNDVSHIDECISWAEKNNFLEGDELEEAKKINDAIKRGAKMPGGCKNKNSCEAYCQSGEHMDECIAFAEAAGFMDKEELEAAKKFLPLMKSGQTPGGCKSREQCKAYCDADEHLDECMAFAEKAGFMRPEELEIARKTGGRGPGGCKRDQCRAYCADPANQDACFAFAKEHGLIKEEDLARFEEGRKYMTEYLEKAPPEVRACIEENLKGDAGRGGFGPGPEIADKMRMCFEKLIPEGLIGEFGHEGGGPGGPGGFGFGPGGFQGPGGCNSIETCTAYCQEHFEECQSFGPAMGRGGPGGPGGPPPGFGGFPGGPGGFGDREGCSFMDFNPVCAIYGNDPEHTFNNACFAKRHGAQIKSEGACPNDVPCERERAPVCGKKEGRVQSYFNACVAKGDGAEVVAEGECDPAKLKEQYRPSSQGSGPSFPAGFGGPGGCKSPQECEAFCRTNPKECGIPNFGGESGASSDFQKMMPPAVEGARPPMIPPPMPPVEFQPSQHPVSPPGGDAYQQEYQRQFQEQYQQQYQQQFQQIQQQYQNQHLPPPQYEGFPGRDLKIFLSSVRDLLNR